MTSHRFATGTLGALCGGAYALGLFTMATLSMTVSTALESERESTYLPFAVFSAPLSLLHAKLIVRGLFVVWPIAGFILASARRRRLPALVLACHAVGVLLVIVAGTPSESAAEQWERFAAARRYAPSALSTSFLIYAIGQVIAWCVLLVPRDGEDDDVP